MGSLYHESGFPSDKLSVVAVAIDFYLILVAIVIIRTVRFKISLAVFGVAVGLLLIACLLDTADEVQRAPAMTATLESAPKQVTTKKPAKKAERDSLD